MLKAYKLIIHKGSLLQEKKIVMRPSLKKLNHYHQISLHKERTVQCAMRHLFKVTFLACHASMNSVLIVSLTTLTAQSIRAVELWNYRVWSKDALNSLHWIKLNISVPRQFKINISSRSKSVKSLRTIILNGVHSQTVSIR